MVHPRMSVELNDNAIFPCYSNANCLVVGVHRVNDFTEMSFLPHLRCSSNAGGKAIAVLLEQTRKEQIGSLGHWA